MTGRTTRLSAAKEAAFLANTAKGHLADQHVASPSITPSKEKESTPAKRIIKAKSTPAKKAKTPAVTRKTASSKKSKTSAAKGKSSPIVKEEVNGEEVKPPASSRKRKRAVSLKVEEGFDELPHNLGRAPGSAQKITNNQADIKKEVKDEDGKDLQTPAKKRASSRQSTSMVKKEKYLTAKSPADTTDTKTEPDSSPSKATRKPKANPYGLTPGETPYPDWPHPTPEDCQEVVRLLSAVHGQVKAPATVPTPSITVSGCGEVPSILDALIRTLLSAATTGTNSTRAFQGLVTRFGLLQEGIGKGSVDWDAVRRADVKDVFEAIKSGGLADTKSKRIKEILELVYAENIARRNALVSAHEEQNKTKAPPGASNESAHEKDAEIIRADSHVLSLDHLHALSSDEALSTLIKYPGIGPKTASCVLLFCMQRPSFAVDTHVFRLCKWLNWVPPDKATRNSTYSHCEVRVPDELKYPLHQLLIKHGKTCPRCRAATGQGGEGWEKGCPIEHLVKRSKKRDANAGAVAKRKKGKKSVESESDEELSEPPESEEDE